MIIGIDFDGTCVTHAYPNIGSDIGSVEVLKSLVNNGHDLILFTMRSDDKLDESVNWFNDNGIPLYGVNVNPKQHTWTNSPKPYCHLYIDDAGLGVPLKIDLALSIRPFVDWNEVKIWLKGMHLIKD